MRERREVARTDRKGERERRTRMTNEIFIAFEKSLKGEFVSANETKRRKGRKSCAQVWLNASNNGMEGGREGARKK